MRVKMVMQRLEKVISECVIEREIPDEYLEPVDPRDQLESEYAINDSYLYDSVYDVEPFSNDFNFREVRREGICLPRVKTIAELNGKRIIDREDIDVGLSFDE